MIEAIQAWKKLDLRTRTRIVAALLMLPGAIILASVVYGIIEAMITVPEVRYFFGTIFAAVVFLGIVFAFSKGYELWRRS